MTATFSLSELREQGYDLRDGKLIRVKAVLRATVHSPPDESAEGTWQQAESDCRAVFEKAGCTVYSTSQRRASKVSPGIPDLIVMGPPGSPFLLFFEVKHGQGKLSEAQRRFQLHCQRTGTRYAAGSKAAARKLLSTLIAEYSAKDTP